jgi:hypothetical protein
MLRVTVSLFPPTTLTGWKENGVTVGAVTDTGAVSVTPFAVAETVTVVFV